MVVWKSVPARAMLEAAAEYGLPNGKALLSSDADRLDHGLQAPLLVETETDAQPIPLPTLIFFDLIL